MALTPIGIIRIGTRKALRRRYAYSALRVFRSTYRAALRAHSARSINPHLSYSITLGDITTAYLNGWRALKRKWPDIESYISDPRAEPDPHTEGSPVYE